MKELHQPKQPSWRKRFRFPASWRTSRRVRFLLYAGLGLFCYLLLMEDVLPQQYDLTPGSVASEAIVSPVTKVDQEATERAREQAAESVGKQYQVDEQLTERQLKRLDTVFSDVRRNLSDDSLSEKEKIANFKDIVPVEMSEEFYLKLARLEAEQLTEMRIVGRDILHDTLSEGVKEDEVEAKQDQVDRALVTSTLAADARFVVRELTREMILPNELFDRERTEKLQDAARDSVEPIPIRKGETIVAAGDVITDDQYRQLQELGVLRDRDNPFPYIGLGLLISLVIGLLAWFTHRFQVEGYRDNLKTLMLVSVFMITLLGMKVVSLGQNLEWSTVGYLAPAALGTMLITLLLNLQLALWCGVILSLFAGMFFNAENHLLFDFRYGLVALMSGSAGAFALAGVRNRLSIFRAGLVAAGASMMTISALYALVPVDGDWTVLLQSLAFGVAGGLFSAVLTIGFLQHFEAMFDILSPLRLLELSNPNHPLLRKLLIETPGTYHHSVIVGNLAEAAAEAVGANGLLARVGSYYHDVGKTKRPQFFIENQLQSENPHDKISPNLSKTIIISHARDGYEMLKEHNIPTPICDIAAQHHGTTLLKYFYFKAKELDDRAQVLEADYRYPGPKAQFKEAAIIGIADCVEAAVRSLARPTPDRIESMVRKIIRDRLEDGQFDECDLTLKELDLIARSMCETLQGIFHSRIEYPDDSQGGKGVKPA
ncbi:HD family phosphohydrolase [Desmospora profundinema]|uniref:Nucleotidyltransferase with HDIG domain n=1 Tax=Desmospora profundinema TaxID=1571184 RepID=A0ABU1IJU0_9BACL|nr:HD family phosphohydrolase [Desmospora profundinema]MDR6225045.1 putative nucleotidyltransferase with HDIG domain [Desmospora profundinema]